MNFYVTHRTRFLKTPLAIPHTQWHLVLLNRIETELATRRDNTGLHWMILLIDNYDSFTYNLVHLVGALGEEVTVKRNDETTPEGALNMGAHAIILSPGPCTPAQAGICVALARSCAEADIPLLGVCLGHQSIAAAHGARITQAEKLMHGKTSQVSHKNTALFKDIPSPFTATRYHSLVAHHDSLPNIIMPLAQADDDGEIMALKIEGTRSYGVQFHPESIASAYGETLMHNFLTIARDEEPGNDESAAP